MTAPDLTAFLLARITEDKTEAQRASEHMRPSWGACATPARILAECDAKRELLALADPYDFADDGGTGMSVHADTILRILAVPYAAHPDYQNEWRP